VPERINDSLEREGGVPERINDSLEREGGVVAHTQMFQNAFRNLTREQPPRPRLFGTGPFFDGAATPPHEEGNTSP